MKLILFFTLLLCVKSAYSQDMIYLTGGTKIPGKVTAIDDDKIVFKNLANPTAEPFVRNISYVQAIFNATGDFLVFNPNFHISEKDKKDFIGEIRKSRPYDILCDPAGNLLSIKIFEENETQIAAFVKGHEAKYIKKNYLFLIRKNGTHEFLSRVDLALPFLGPSRGIIDDLLAQPDDNDVAKIKPQSSLPKAAGDDADYIAPDMTLFGTKSLQKVTDFTGYLQAIASVNSNRETAVKSINLACDLFIGEEARVEVTANNIPKKYIIRDYLNRLMIKAGQYDKVTIEYANINYASKFKKGPDGNYYGTVTFVQKFQGFVDGNLVYGDQTTRSVTIVLKHYEKEVNGQSVSGWDVFLDDIGVVESKKI